MFSFSSAGCVPFSASIISDYFRTVSSHLLIDNGCVLFYNLIFKNEDLFNNLVWVPMYLN